MTPKVVPYTEPSIDLIDVELPEAVMAPAQVELERVKEAEALVRTMVKAEIAAQASGFEARAQAVLDSAEATAGKILSLMGSMKPKVVGIKINEQAPVVLKDRPHKAFSELATEVEIYSQAGLQLNFALTGPRGSGKTTLAKQLAEARKVPFSFVSVQRGMSPAEFFGRWTPDTKNPFVSAPLWSMLDKPGVYLLDEFDRGDSNTMCAINALTANGIAVNPYTGETKRRHPEFVILAAMNTTGRGATADYNSAERLDASTLDRFAMLRVEYDRELEAELCPFPELLGKLHTARENLEKGKAKECVGTRTIQRAAAYHRAGYDIPKIAARIFEGWDQNSVRMAAFA
jgi:hypothetical protein